MGLKDRLLKFIEYTGLDIAVFERSIGLSNGAVHKMGEGTRASTIDKISAKYPILNTAWLKTGVGEMIKSPSQPTSIHANGISTNYQGNFNDVYTSIGGSGTSSEIKKKKTLIKNEGENKNNEDERLRIENSSLKAENEKLKQEIERLTKELLNEKERLIKSLLKE